MSVYNGELKAYRDRTRLFYRSCKMKRYLEICTIKLEVIGQFAEVELISKVLQVIIFDNK